MPTRVAIKLFSTGVGLREGEPDPHWWLVARSDDPHFKPRPAVVTSYDVRFYLAVDPLRSQYLSTGNGLPDLPNGVIYTFRTTFEIAGPYQGGALLWGWFIADNHVKAIRLNGKNMPVPEHADDNFAQPHDFSVRSGFADGSNVLEIDVENDSAADRAEKRTTSPMLLRVELEGSASTVLGPTEVASPGPAAGQSGKGGASKQK